MNSAQKLLLQNKAWAQERVRYDKDFFARHANVQTPEFLWIGCSDSRVPANEIMGLEPGEGKYAGTTGSIIFGQYKEGPRRTFTLTKMGTCSGMDDATRYALNMKKHGGLVFEITHLGREPTGAFRSPQFSRWRPDKQPRQCTMDQLHGEARPSRLIREMRL